MRTSEIDAELTLTQKCVLSLSYYKSTRLDTGVLTEKHRLDTGVLTEG